MSDSSTGPASLTQEEAAERAALLDVKRYDVTVDLTGLLEGDRAVTTATVTFACARPGASTFVDCVALIDSATLNGKPLDVTTASRGRLPLPALEATNTLVVAAHQDDTGSATGILKTVDPSDGLVYVWTSFEPDEARRLWACFDQPDLKAVHRFTAVVPDAWTALSNTPPASATDADGVRTVVFEETPRLSPYVTVVNAGPFHELRREAGGYDLGLYCRQSLVPALEATAEDLFTFTEHGLAWFGERFGLRFPQRRYDQIMVPDMGGAMENWGAVTHGDFLLYRTPPTHRTRAYCAEFVLHEMAHMWFGDLVTMRWWDDLWLNEAFASWAASWALAGIPEFADVWATFTVGGKVLAYRQDLSPATHPIRGEVHDVDQATANFDAITYEKGLSVLAQLVAYLGEDAFLAGLRSYFRDHAYGNTVLGDLMDAVGAAAGTDLSGWTEAWLDHAGTDVVALEEDRTTLTVTSPDGAAPRPHRLDISSYDDEGSLLATTAVTTTGSRMPVGLPPAAVHLLNAGDLTFASVRPDAASAQWLRAHAGRLPDPMSRALAVGGAWDGLFRGRTGGPAFLDLALSVLATERAPGIVEAVLALAATAAEKWTPSDRVAEQRDRLARTAAELADVPDLELPALRVLANHASGPDHFARLEGPAAADTELAWRVLIRRAELGDHDQAAVRGLQERDPDPEAWVSALAVEAARPSASAKERAWHSVMVEASVPLVDAFWLLTAAFWRPGQEALLRPYAGRYLEAAAAIGSGGMLDKGPRLGRMYPELVAEDEFLVAAEAVADDDRIPAFVRQSLRRANDTQSRMLAARRC